ncbi:MAG: M15 family metallopeptidase [Microcoleaceae cyanobacterium]
MLKPYQTIPIEECGESLTAIPLHHFVVQSPHPYQMLGAPYELSPVDSPYYLRQEVVDRLIQAQVRLEALRRGWKILIFDAYRPIEVQRFMVDYTFADLLKQKGLTPDSLSAEQHQSLLEEVHQFWAVPSPSLATPPPHSTGAAIDVTLADADQNPVDMGSPIDEISSRSFPSHFAESCDPQEQHYHQNRQILAQLMTSAGFQQHPNEWWHFSYGDQMWAWLNRQRDDAIMMARYGRY